MLYINIINTSCTIPYANVDKLFRSLYMKKAARTTTHAAIETVAVDAPL